MRSTKYYVKKFKLDQEGSNFDRVEFIQELGKEFLERVQITKKLREMQNLDFPFYIFQRTIKEMEDKFWAISNKRVGKPFTPDLFSLFFATIVIPYRAQNFPKEHEEISEKRKKYLNNKNPKP